MDFLSIDFSELAKATINFVGAFGVFLGAAYALALVVPGDQPDKAIKALLDFTTKFSKK